MEAIVRFSSALTIFIIMVSWEVFAPRRKQAMDRRLRWPTNLGLAAFNMVLMRLTIGGLGYWSAIQASEQSFGILHWFNVSLPVSICLTLVILDLAVYFQHIVMHKVPLLWRLHQVHHTDTEFDATTAVRFHPLEILLSMLYKTIWIMALGANPIAVVAFEIILNGAATFNHSNVNLPKKIDDKLRWLIITPDMHRIHHSVILNERDSNYGFSVSWWDRLFGTYVAEPERLHTDMDIGLKKFRKIDELGFLPLIQLPFKAQP